MELYTAGTGNGQRGAIAVNECDVPCTMHVLNLAQGDQKKPDYLKLNPNGSVPTLVDGDLVLWESAAICQYLADKFPDKRLAPPVGPPERGKYYQWIHYAMSGLEPAAVTIFLHTIQRPEADRVPALVNEAKQQLGAAIKVVDGALTGREWMLGSQFTAADVMVGSTLAWCQMMGMLGDGSPNATAYLGRCAARPAFQRASA